MSSKCYYRVITKDGVIKTIFEDYDLWVKNLEWYYVEGTRVLYDTDPNLMVVQKIQVMENIEEEISFVDILLQAEERRKAADIVRAIEDLERSRIEYLRLKKIFEGADATKDG